METTLEELEELFNSLKEDAPKFLEKGNKAAGKRMRKSAMEMKKLLHDFRKEIQEEISLL